MHGFSSDFFTVHYKKTRSGRGDVCGRSAVDSTSEKRLITMLVENYRQNGVDGRPVVNTSTALTVTISFSLIQILQFNPTQQIITIVGWISLVRPCVCL